MCPLCEIRRPKRHCPALAQAICPQCCGTYREVTIDCAESCPHLLASRRYDREEGAEPPPPIAPEYVLSERAVRAHSLLLGYLTRAIVVYWRENPALADSDLFASLEGLMRTLATSRAGIIYESRPVGALRDGLFRALEAAWAEYRREDREAMRLEPAREGDFEAMVVFLARGAQMQANGRPRSRRALAWLATLAPQATTTMPNLVVVP